MKIIKLFSTLKKFGFDGFIFFLILFIFLAYLFPAIGAKNSPIPLSGIAKIGVSFIFFFYGVRMNTKKLLADIRNWKVHLLTQSGTYLIYPAIVFLFHAIFPRLFQPELWVGIYFLSCLPSTVSTAVVMTSIARGNVAAAIFNSSISMLIGVFVTPIWMGIMINTQTQEYNALDILLKIFLQIILPVLIGISLNKYLGSFAEKHKIKLRLYDQSVILLIIYTSFCDSFQNHVFSGYTFWFLLQLLFILFILFITVFLLLFFISKIFNFPIEDRISCMFCGAKKSLVHGTVLAKVLFAGNPSLGVFLLPIMIFHPMQLIWVSFFATRFKQRKQSI